MNDKAKSTEWRTYWRLLGYLRRWKLVFLGSVIGFFVYGLSQAGLAHLMKFFVDGLQTTKTDYLYIVPLGLILIAFVRGLGFFAGNYLIAKVSMNIVHELRCQVFNQLMHLPKAYYDKNNVGELLSLLLYNVQQLSGTATDGLKIIIREGFTLIALIGYLIWMNAELTVFFLLVTPIIGIIVYYVGKRLKAITQRLQTSMGSITHVAKESLSSIFIVRIFAGQTQEQQRFQQASHEATSSGLKMVRTTAATAPLMQFIVAIALAGLMYAVLRFFNDQSAGEIIAYITAAGLIPKPLRVLSDVWGTLQRGLVAAESVFGTLDLEQEKNTGQIKQAEISGTIKAEHLYFQYENADNAAIQDVSFKIEAGQMVALVGHSGSGKTTLANLLLRFYEYDNGKLCLDGKELKEYDLFFLRQQFSLVSQHTELFNDSIRNNIQYGANEPVSDSVLWQALSQANADQFVAELPQGLDTLIGENGSQLSGGQKQRLAIARALIKDAPILILDEATSALDSQSESDIKDSIDISTKSKTTIVIAHRLSTIINADKILVFNQGQIVESGTHSELLTQGAVYKRLYETNFSTD